MDDIGGVAGPGAPRSPGRVLGVSLKLYLGVEETRQWATEIARIVRSRPAVATGALEVFVLPSLPALPVVRDAFAGTSVRVGAQDLHWADRGAFTGAVSGADLREIGCTHVEVGHVERRAVFGEGGDVARLKMQAALRNGLTPVLCVGESTKSAPAVAAEHCLGQIASVLEGTDDAGDGMIVAYEPEWAIGQTHPAPADYVRAVAATLRRSLAQRGRSARLIYGGSAQHGTLTELADAVDGLFLGRFAHDPAAFARMLDEAAALC